MNQQVNISTLTPSQQQQAISWLRSKKRMPCPCCGGGNVNIGDHLVQTQQFAGGSMVIGGPVMPMFLTTCDNCGNVQFYAAILAGLISRP